MLSTQLNSSLNYSSNAIDIFEEYKEKKNINSLLINNKNVENIKVLEEILNHFYHNIYYPYCPILIKGKSGTGKTFLLKYIEKKLEKNLYIHVNELPFLLETKEKMFQFLSEIKEKNCLIIDDIHLLANDEKIQDDLAYLIDMLIDAQKNIIFSMNPESSHKELKQKLLSRMSMGLILPLQEPDLDLRTQYAQICLEEFDISLKREVVLYIGRRVLTYREIKSTVINIKSFYEKMRKKPLINDIEKILKDAGNILLTSEQIIQYIANYYDLDAKDIKGNKREARLVEARRISMYIIRKLLNTTYTDIAKTFGGKDHTTIMYAIRKIEEIIVTNKVMHNEVTKLLKLCKTQAT